MFRHLFGKSFLVPALALGALMAVPAVSHAQFSQGDWVLTLAGAGTNDREFNNGVFAVQGSLGYFVTPNVEVLVRQSVGYVDHPSSTTGVTQIAADWVFNFGAWAPYIGANAGILYGTRQRGSCEIGPEAGIRYFINATTFAFVQAEWDLRNVNELKSEFVYTAGLGVKLK